MKYFCPKCHKYGYWKRPLHYCDDCRAESPAINESEQEYIDLLQEIDKDPDNVMDALFKAFTKPKKRK